MSNELMEVTRRPSSPLPDSGKAVHLKVDSGAHPASPARGRAHIQTQHDPAARKRTTGPEARAFPYLGARSTGVGYLRPTSPTYAHPACVRDPRDPRAGCAATVRRLSSPSPSRSRASRPSQAVYGASKVFVLLFGEARHGEVAADGVYVSAVCPGPTGHRLRGQPGCPPRLPRPVSPQPGGIHT